MKRVRRILFILHLPPPIHGAAMMGQYIHDSKVVNERFDCKYINLSTATGLEDIGKFSFHKFLRFQRLYNHIKKEVKSFQPDLIYITPNTHGLAFYKEFFIVRQLKRMGKRIVMHFHNKGVREHQGNAMSRWLYKQFFKDTEIILLSEHLYADISQYAGKEQVSVCPNGIPPANKCVIQSAEETSSPATILFLSNLLRAKGLVDLLDACKILTKRNIGYTCHIVGGETKEFNMDSIMREIENRQLTDNVQYLGRKTGKEKEAEYEKARLFVFPSHDECFPLVLLEAMQHRLPCVTTTVGGTVDIVENGKTGYWIDSQSPEALAEKIEHLIQHPEKGREMGMQGYEKYQKEYTLEKFEQRFVTILEDIINKQETC